MNFVGVYSAPGVSHGPPVSFSDPPPEGWDYEKVGGGYSCTYSGHNTWAVDELGFVYNLATDLRPGKKMRRVWVRFEADVIEGPL